MVDEYYEVLFTNLLYNFATINRVSLTLHKSIPMNNTKKRIEGLNKYPRILFCAFWKLIYSEASFPDLPDRILQSFRQSDTSNLMDDRKLPGLAC